VCVQNFYNITRREDDPLVKLTAREGIAYVPCFPLGGFSPLQSDDLDAVAAAWHNADGGFARLAAPAVCQHPADPGYVVARTPARERRRRWARAAA
jgi:hypothetical protein